MGAGDAHERERSILAVRGVLEYDFKQADGGLAIPEAYAEEPAAVARTVQQRAGNAILFADDLVKLRGVRITAHDLLKGPERLDIPMARQLNIAGMVKGVGRVNGIGITLGDSLVDIERLPVALVFFCGSGPVHHRQRIPALLPGKARGQSALDLPAALRRPGQIGR